MALQVGRNREADGRAVPYWERFVAELRAGLARRPQSRCEPSVDNRK